LHRMETEGKRILVTFGGAYSNHLVAAAVAAELIGYRSIGILRGDEPLDNHYLRVARGAGMTLVGVSRALYRDKLEALSVVLGDQGLSEEAVYVVAEGGKGEAGFEGFQSLVDGWCARGIAFQHIFHASATATTALGLRIALDQRDLMAEIHAVMVLKNWAEQQGFAEEQGISEKLNFVSGYEFGGYAKGDASLYAFIDQVVARNDVPIDWVYTGKALFALNEWLEVEAKKGTVVSDATGVFPVLFLHTGGVLCQPK
jgi:1-aminocyclopropane-1-carboxylate deaminase